MTSQRALVLAALGLSLALSACAYDGPPRPDPEQQLAMHREFALRYFDQGDVDRAEQQVDKGLEISDKDPQLLLMKGWIRQRRGKTQDIQVAEAIFRDLLPGEDYRAQLGLAEALERKGVLYTETADAIASGQRFTERADPQARAVELREDAADAWTEAERHYRGALQKKPGEFQAMNGLQRVLALRGDLDGSLEWADRLLELSDQERIFWRAQLERPGLSAREENRLLDLLAGSEGLQIETNLTASTLLLRLKRPAEALVHVDAALALAPGRADIHSRRGQLLCALGRYDEASDSLQTFLRLSDLPFEHPDVRRAYDLIDECARASRLEAAAR